MINTTTSRSLVVHVVALLSLVLTVILWRFPYGGSTFAQEPLDLNRLLVLTDEQDTTLAKQELISESAGLSTYGNGTLIDISSVKYGWANKHNSKHYGDGYIDVKIGVSTKTPDNSYQLVACAIPKQQRNALHTLSPGEEIFFKGVIAGQKNYSSLISTPGDPLVVLTSCTLASRSSEQKN